MWLAGALGFAPDGPAEVPRVRCVGAMLLIAIVRALGLFGGRRGSSRPSDAGVRVAATCLRRIAWPGTVFAGGDGPELRFGRLLHLDVAALDQQPFQVGHVVGAVQAAHQDLPDVPVAGVLLQPVVIPHLLRRLLADEEVARALHDLEQVRRPRRGRRGRRSISNSRSSSLLASHPSRSRGASGKALEVRLRPVLRVASSPSACAVRTAPRRGAGTRPAPSRRRP